MREPNASNTFDDVTLDCAGALTGWQPMGDDEWTRIDLSSQSFVGQNGCDNGQHAMKSATPFGLWVWGWGTPLTSTFTANVSYGYPAGRGVSRLDSVVVAP